MRKLWTLLLWRIHWSCEVVSVRSCTPFVCSVTLNGVTFSYKNSERLSEYFASATVPTEQTSIIYTLHENGGSTNRISSTKEVNPITKKSAHVIISNTAKFQSVHTCICVLLFWTLHSKSLILRLFDQQLWNLAVLLILSGSFSWQGSFVG